MATYFDVSMERQVNCKLHDGELEVYSKNYCIPIPFGCKMGRQRYYLTESISNGFLLGNSSPKKYHLLCLTFGTSFLRSVRSSDNSPEDWLSLCSSSANVLKRWNIHCVYPESERDEVDGKLDQRKKGQ